MTIDLEPVEVTVDSMKRSFGVRRDWPREGRWVIAASATTSYSVADPKTGERKNRPVILRAVVPIGEDGAPVTRATPGGRHATMVNVLRPLTPSAWGKTVAGLLSDEPGTPVAKAP